MHPAEHIKGCKDDLLAGKRIVLAVTGSIAAVETVRLARELVRHGADVVPAMSSAATRIIHPDSLWFACGIRPVVELTGAVEHVSLCGEVPDRADLLLIAPCTANTVGKIACGVDDTVVTTMATTAIGTGIPVMVVPAMHSSMYNNPIVGENLKKLEDAGIYFVSPRFEEKKAKMASVEDVVASALRVLGPGSLEGKKVLVVAGATQEPLDDMRMVTNRSTGKMGSEIALEAFRLGGDVVLLMGSGGCVAHNGISRQEFVTSSQLFDIVGKMDAFDVIIVPAAISDYAPVVVKGKIPSGKDDLTVEMQALPKLLPVLRKLARVLVAFKAESNVEKSVLENRSRKLLDLADIVVANDIKDVDEDSTSVLIVKNQGVLEAKGGKDVVSRAIMEEVCRLV